MGNNATILQFKSYCLDRSISMVWTFENFSGCLKKNTIKFKSPLFSCGHTEWRLQNYSTDDSQLDSTDFISLYIVMLKSKGLLHNVYYKIGFKDSLGNDQSSFEGRYDFTDEENSRGKENIIAIRELLEERRESLLPNDTLTIFCDLKLRSGIEWRQTCTQDIFPACFSDIMCNDISALLKSRKNCDVTFHVQEEQFPAHKLILGARSSVFAAMFDHDMQENGTNVVAISDIRPTIFSKMLDYIYSGYVLKVSSKHACELYAAADKYGLMELNWKCRDIIIDCLSVETFCDVAVLADTHNDEKMMDGLKLFVTNSFSDLVPTRYWENFLKKNPALATKILQKAGYGISKPILKTGRDGKKYFKPRYT